MAISTATDAASPLVPQIEGRLLLHDISWETYEGLLEVERNVALSGYGSATFRKRAKERGLEPDECYVLASRPMDMPDDMPDIAIEVVYRHGGINKLEVHAGLGIPEVWYWMDGRLVVFRLAGEQYERQEGSTCLPDLDLAQLSAFALRSDGADQTELVRQYRDALRAKP